MAERRMFAKSVIDSDLFLDMPPTTQMLYFHLAMRADDDGFINNPRRIQRMIGASDDDMRILIAKQFILTFENGVIVIRHWKLHNYIRKDMYHPTEYQAERQMLSLKNNKSPYELNADAGSQDSSRTCNGYVTDSSRTCNETVSIGKDRKGKDRIGKVRLDAAATHTRDTTPDTNCQDVDNNLAECIKLYANNINPLMGGIEQEQLLSLYDQYHAEWLKEAIKEAVSTGGRSIKYIQCILDRWSREGFKSSRKKHRQANQADQADADELYQQGMAALKEMGMMEDGQDKQV